MVGVFTTHFDRFIVGWVDCSTETIPETEKVRVVIVKMLMVLVVECHAHHWAREACCAICEIFKPGMADLAVDVVPKAMQAKDCCGNGQENRRNKVIRLHSKRVGKRV